MKIGIIGGGNLGSVLAVKFSQEHEVILYTNLIDKVHLYQSDMEVYCEDNNSYYRGKDIKYTTSIKELAKESSYIFVTFPSFLFEELAKELIPHLNKGHHLVFVPGSGGAELFFKAALKKGATITGLQRVHSVARITEFGKQVRESGVKSLLRIASIPNSYNEQARKDLEELYHIKVEKLHNYLNVTFVNSNPILHTSRLYTIFKEYPDKKEYDSLPLFYEEWNDESSILLMEMDKELFDIFDVLEVHGLPIKEITPIAQYYDSETYSQLTNKLISIKAFKGIGTPSIKNSNGTYSPDLSSRYFTADFPFGLDILLAYGEFLKLHLPHMTQVSNWYHKVSNTKKTFSLDQFGIQSIEDLVKIYK